MGYCCFCIPLSVYGLVYASVEILFSTIDFVEVCVHSMPEDELDLVLPQFLVDIAVIITAVLLIYGIVQRRYEYFVPFLMLTAILICLICLSIFLVSLRSPVILFLMILVVTCLFAIPIYLLYVEIRNENIIAIANANV